MRHSLLAGALTYDLAGWIDELGLVAIIIPDIGRCPEKMVAAGRRCIGATVDVNAVAWLELVSRKVVGLRTNDG